MNDVRDHRSSMYVVLTLTSVSSSNKGNQDQNFKTCFILLFYSLFHLTLLLRLCFSTTEPENQIVKLNMILINLSQTEPRANRTTDKQKITQVDLYEPLAHGLLQQNLMENTNKTLIRQNHKCAYLHTNRSS